MQRDDPSTSAPEPPHYLVEKIREALAQDPRTNELDVRVKIKGARVFISGHVATEERRKAIGAVAAEVMPGYTIHNDTTVNDFSDPAGAEELSS